jgi:hypothetical protein
MPSNRDSAKPNALQDEVEAVELKSGEESQMAVALVNETANSSGQTKTFDSSIVAPATAMGQLSKDAIEKELAPDSPVDTGESGRSKRPNSPGMRRHKLTLAATALLALGVLALNVFDLKPLISEEGTINRGFVFTPTPKMAELPVNASYTDGKLKEGLVPISALTLDGQRLGFADAKGHVVIAPAFARTKNFSDGLAAVKMPGEDGKWGFINHAGSFVIPAIFTSINSFHDGFASVKVDGGYQIIDKNGKPCLPPNSHTIKEAWGSFFIVGNANHKQWGVMRGRELLIPQRYSDIDGVSKSFNYQTFASDRQDFTERVNQEYNNSPPQYFVLHQDALCGLADSAGKICFEPRFKNILNVHKGHVSVWQDESYGFTDLSGKVVIPPQFDQATAYDDLIAVRNDDTVHLIDSAGKPVKSVAIDNIVYDRQTSEWLQDGAGIFKRNDLYGYLDNHGNEIIAPKFKSAHPFANGLARVYDGSRWIFIDKHGDAVTKTSYVQASRFRDGKAQVTVPGPFYTAIEEWPKSLLISKPAKPRDKNEWSQSKEFESVEE